MNEPKQTERENVSEIKQQKITDRVITFPTSTTNTRMKEEQMNDQLNKLTLERLNN